MIENTTGAGLSSDTPAAPTADLSPGDGAAPAGVPSAWDAARAEDVIAREERQRVDAFMRAEFEHEYEANSRLIRNLVRGLSKEELARLNAREDDGELLRELARRARGGPVPTGIEAIQKEITEIEKFMRTDRGAYNRDLRKQARLRDLYRARGS